MADTFFKILVVDDDEAMREVCSEVLTSEGYDVSVASDGWEALGLCTQGWDLIISDVNMPGLDGIGFYRAAVSRVPEISGKFIFMTGDRSSARVIEGMNCMLVKKPFKVRDLLDLVESVLKDSAASRKDKRVSLNGCGLQIRINGSELAAVAEDLSLNGMKCFKISIDALNICRREGRMVRRSRHGVFPGHREAGPGFHARRSGS
jgi:DNA-binding response OmpR family regulator